jgi:hypothetical protein
MCQKADATAASNKAALTASMGEIEKQVKLIKLPATASVDEKKALEKLQKSGGVAASAAAVETKVGGAAKAALDKKIAKKVAKDAAVTKCNAEKDADKKTTCLKAAKYAGVTCKDLTDAVAKKACETAKASASALVATAVTLISVAALF